MPARTFNTV